MAVITSFTQISSSTLQCFLNKRGDALNYAYSIDKTPENTTEEELKTLLDNWWYGQGVAKYEGNTLGQYLEGIGCTVTVPSESTQQPTTPSLSSLLSPPYVYGLYALGGYIALKMLRIIR